MAKEAPESPQMSPKEGLIKANEIILKILEELACPLCDGDGEICTHTDYIEISTFIQSMIAKCNR